MKLSLTKRFGWIQVRGGALVKIAQDHAVSTVGRPEPIQCEKTHGPRPADPPQDGKGWVYAKVGDLAVEVVAKKTGKVLGHSYLSGPAIQCNRYTPAQAGWFEPATGKLLSLPDKPETTFKSLVAARYSGVDICAFEAIVADEEEMKTAMHFCAAIRNYEPADGGSPTSHLVALFQVGKKPGKGPSAILHFQPEHHTSEHCATPFQIGLVLSALRGEEKR